MELLEVHPLQSADACQLAAALVCVQEDPERVTILCFARRLESAAVKEGFVVCLLNNFEDMALIERRFPHSSG